MLIFFILIISLTLIESLIIVNLLGYNNSTNAGGTPDIVNNNTLNISKFVTASDVEGLGNYIKNDTFYQGEKFFAYLEYDGCEIDINGNCNLTLKIIINEIKGEKSYTNSFFENNANKIEHHWTIQTYNTWNPGSYYVVIYITDDLTNKLINKFTIFLIKLKLLI